MKGIEAAATRQRLEAMREAVAVQAVGPAELPPHGSISLRMARYGTAPADAQAMVRDADEALYRAKRSGRTGRNRLLAAPNAGG